MHSFFRGKWQSIAFRLVRKEWFFTEFCPHGMTPGTKDKRENYKYPGSWEKKMHSIDRDTCLPIRKEKNTIFLAFLRLPLCLPYVLPVTRQHGVNIGIWKHTNFFLSSVTFFSITSVFSQCASEEKKSQCQSGLDRPDLTFACPHGTKKICSKDRIAGDRGKFSCAHLQHFLVQRFRQPSSHTRQWMQIGTVVVVHTMVPTQML